MERRRFGQTDLEVAPIGLGCWGVSGDWGPVDRAEALATLRRAFDLGVTFFDTADMYGRGRSEELIREALGPRRREVVIATKGGMNFYEGERHLDFRPTYIEFALRESLRRLGTDYVDLYQLHNPEPRHLTDELFALLERLKASGAIRYYGVSLNSRAEGVAELAGRPVASVQAIYNLLDQRAARSVFPWAQQAGVAVVARVPLASGLLTGKLTPEWTFAEGDHRRRRPREWLVEGLAQAERYRFLVRDGRTLAQAAIRFVLAHPAVTVTIPGAKSPRQVEENLSAL
ncbi:MAG TPA: aldo/keto reductase, partial [Thermodesulfobacteriota bacterium]|nr:aldo/keto reductase [Thermodesulfobacteriota bacterium]